MEKKQNPEVVVQTSRQAFATGRTIPVDFRMRQLRSLRQMIDECHQEFVSALNADLRKPKMEAKLFELEVVKAEIDFFIRSFKNFVKNEELPLNLLASLDRGHIQREPYGVVLILGAWNYPFSLSVLPMIGAIAAGNCVVLKPSEMSPHTAKALGKNIPRFLDSECYQVFEADLEMTKELLNNKFDYIFATGSVGMGKSVMAAAAPHLTPVTLELGGKSPVYIDDSSDFDLAAKRILWGKCMNLGQTCIAPDYLLCSKKAEKEFVKVAQRVMNEWYGNQNWKASPDLPRIVNERNFLRLQKMIEQTNGRIAFGGQMDQQDLWISPTIVVDVTQSDIVMQEEIFGPILPILTAESADEAIKIILSRPKPLAVYVFSKNSSAIKSLVNKTSSGGVCINDVLWHNAWEGLPFGGVGESGMGNYHGRYSFETFSHRKAVLERGFSYLSEKLGEARYPPYNENKERFFTFVIRYMHSFNVRPLPYLSHLFAGCLGAFFLYFYLNYLK